VIIAKNIAQLKDTVRGWKKEDHTIGFIPTMGFLHAGHLDLVRSSKEKCHKSIVSIFVNPTQFNDPEDYLKYPMDIEGDLKKCETSGVDLVFLPNKEDLYPSDEGNITLTQAELQKNLCGKTRPGHFEGVMLVVSKFFNLVQPDVSFFGQKDFQQLRIIEEMVRLLNFPIQIIGVPTLREQDGLAMSSRNVRLSPKERETAAFIPRMFSLAKRVIENGEKDVSTFHEILADFLLSAPNLRIDYIETVDPKRLQTIETLENEFLLAIAVFVGNTRLIDNNIIQPKLNS